jgi:hypothetical protein
MLKLPSIFSLMVNQHPLDINKYPVTSYLILRWISLVKHNSVRIAFLLAALNGLDILSADIGNAYINADAREKVCFVAGDEFGASHKGHAVLIVKALYGLKTSGAAWRAHFAKTLHSLGYSSSLANLDVWYRPEMKDDGFEYYAYCIGLRG